MKKVWRFICDAFGPQVPKRFYDEAMAGWKNSLDAIAEIKGVQEIVVSEMDQCRPKVMFHDEFLQPARSKVVFLQGQGGRVVELVLEDSAGRSCRVDRWGKVVWLDGREEAQAAQKIPEAGK